MGSGSLERGRGLFGVFCEVEVGLVEDCGFWLGFFSF